MEDTQGGREMRITEDRYTRERIRFDLALRMIRHEARTRTIRSCTGLSDDRIRKLYKTYVETHTEPRIRRRRGKSPRQVAYFTRSTQTQLEASLLTSCFATFGLLKLCGERPVSENTLEFGRSFCDAYEAYLGYQRQHRISFEHAWFLRRVLAERVELCLNSCVRCGSPFVCDPLALDQRGCPLCRSKDVALLSQFDRRSPTERRQLRGLRMLRNSAKQA
jgi:hypothetical protein